LAVPSNRVTPLRVAALVAITVVALAFVALRWSTSDDVVVLPDTGTTRGTVDTGSTGTTDPLEVEQLELLSCIRYNESRGEYNAVSANGQYFGAYQFDQQTWNNTAQYAGYTNLVGVQPNEASPADQDAVALALLQWQGTWPWNGDPCVS
jgi:hypothetical protein